MWNNKAAAGFFYGIAFTLLVFAIMVTSFKVAGVVLLFVTVATLLGMMNDPTFTVKK